MPIEDNIPERSSNPTRVHSRIGNIIGLNHASTIDFVIDYTPSMETVLPMVYLTCWDIITSIGVGYSGPQFGLTFLSDDVRQKHWDGKCFTKSKEDILNALYNEEIKGGHRDSIDNIGKAIHDSLNKLSAVPEKERVIVVFTDVYQEQYIDMLRQPAVRSVILYMPPSAGIYYRFRMVDDNGVWNNSKSPFVYDIHDIVKERYLKKVVGSDNIEKKRASIAAINQIVKSLS